MRALCLALVPGPLRREKSLPMEEEFEDEMVDMDNVKEHLYKVLVIGEYGVGESIKVFLPLYISLL